MTEKIKPYPNVVAEYSKSKIGYQKGALDKNTGNFQTVGDKKILPKIEVQEVKSN